MKLTARQQQILDYLIETIASDGMPPTRAELCRHFGFKSPNAAEDHLRALANKGAIELISGSSRGIPVARRHPGRFACGGVSGSGRATACG